MYARARGLVALAAAPFCLAATVGLAGPAPAAPAAADPLHCRAPVPAVGDIDGDGTADLVVGVPNHAHSTGTVDVRLSGSTPSAVTMGFVAHPGVPGDRFGQSVALGDLDADGCADLVIGAPGAAGGAGRVFVAHGEGGGILPGGETLTGPATRGDGFGSSVALARNGAGDGFDLWVGSPRDDVAGRADAGSVTHYAVTATAGAATFTDLGTVTQDTPGVPGVAEAGDRFGAVLSASRYGVLVGDPLEDVGGARDAGSATWLMTGPMTGPMTGLMTGPAAGPVDHALGWTQSSPGVPGPAETGDHFGAAVGVWGDSAVVGAPGEDVRAVEDAGLVQTFLPSTPGRPRPGRALHQDSAGMPGAAEPGDRFGASVVLGRNMTCIDEDTLDAAVGAPREDLRVHGRQVADAGSVTLLVLRTATGSSCPAHSVSQGAVLDGQPEAGDRLGASLGLGRRPDDVEADVFSDQAFIGVPGEDKGRVVDSGTVQSTPHGSGGGSTSIALVNGNRTMVGHIGGAVAHLRFGTVLASPAGD